MDRRSFLAAGGASLTAATAGCLSSAMFWRSDDVVLDEPDYYDDFEQVQQSREAGHLDIPIYGDELPEATVPDALGDEDVTTTGFIDDRHVLITFLFTRCPTVCETLTYNLVQVQHEALDSGYADDIALLPVTFDPEYDTPDILEEYSEERGAALDDESWHFLRPENEDRAREVVTDTFGVTFTYAGDEVDPDDHDHHPPADEPDGELGSDHGDHDEKLFAHDTLLLLANKNGYVERGGMYSPNAGRLVQDVNELVDRW